MKTKSRWIQTWALVFAAGLMFGTQDSLAEITLEGLQDHLKENGFTRWYESPPEDYEPPIIAIFDIDFKGYENEVGEDLPVNTVYHPGPLNRPATPENQSTDKFGHGTVMASIVYQSMTNEGVNPELAPAEFHLYNVDGYSNFIAAINEAIAKDVDVILYSGYQEVGGNWDGRGFINSSVNKATDAGILWVNAAGNFANLTYQSGIETGNEDWVDLPDRNNSIEIICEPDDKAKAKKCAARVVLLWSRFSQDPLEGTDYDLDLSLSDDMLNVISTSVLKQVRENPENYPGNSLYPREALIADLEPGRYFIRVKNRSQNFSRRDELRILVDGDFIRMPSGQSSESIVNPADNPNVITVGAYDEPRSGRSVSLDKPEVVAPSVLFLDGEGYSGSSNAAASVAAGAGLVRGAIPILQWMNSKQRFGISKEILRCLLIATVTQKMVFLGL
jgi:subtilisin family serine protease